MANTIDDRLLGQRTKEVGQKKPNDNSNSLESKVSSSGFFRSIGRIAMTAGTVAAAYGLVGKSSLLTAAGNAVGYLIEKVKGKEKVKEGELHKEIRTGGIMGTIGYALYSMIDFIPNYNTPLKLLKTVAFNPIMLAPYVAFYQTFTYLRDKVGLAKSAIGMVNLKIFNYLRDAYRNEIKPNFYKSMKKIMYLMPIHFASINYVTEIWKRVAIGVFNDIAFRLFQGKKKENPGYHKSANPYKNIGYAPNPAY